MKSGRPEDDPFSYMMLGVMGSDYIAETSGADLGSPDFGGLPEEMADVASVRPFGADIGDQLKECRLPLSSVIVTYSGKITVIGGNSSNDPSPDD